MMRTIGWLSAVLIGFFVATGCGQILDDDSSPDGETSETGMSLSVDINAGTDVAGFYYAIRECGDRPIVAEGRKALEDLVLPGMIPKFENEPFDANSRHLFSDFFTVLPAGCYDVAIQPLTDRDTPSEQCDIASAQGVDVLEGATTEILLVSQCKGPEIGALDVVAALNHPPVIRSVKFEKFNHECDKIKICATASDPDNDLIQFNWKKTDGPKLVKGIRVIGEKPCVGWYCEYLKWKHKIVYEGKGTECIKLQLGTAGDYEFKVTVRDLGWDGNKMVPFDNSWDSLSFPVYAAENPDIKCPPKKKYPFGDVRY